MMSGGLRTEEITASMRKYIISILKRNILNKLRQKLIENNESLTAIIGIIKVVDTYKFDTFELLEGDEVYLFNFSDQNIPLDCGHYSCSAKEFLAQYFTLYDSILDKEEYNLVVGYILFQIYPFNKYDISKDEDCVELFKYIMDFVGIPIVKIRQC